MGSDENNTLAEELIPMEDFGDSNFTSDIDNADEIGAAAAAVVLLLLSFGIATIICICGCKSKDGYTPIQ